MADKNNLMGLLGKPSTPMGPGPEAPGKKGGYLSTKPPELQGYLEDAVDPSLDPAARAEALCRAIEFQAGETEPDDDDTGDGDAGAADTSGDGDY